MKYNKNMCICYNFIENLYVDIFKFIKLFQKLLISILSEQKSKNWLMIKIKVTSISLFYDTRLQIYIIVKFLNFSQLYKHLRFSLSYKVVGRIFHPRD